MADLEKCKLENVKFYNAYNFFLCKPKSVIPLVLGSPRLGS